MLHFKLINKIIGHLLLIEAFLMSWCLVVSIIYHEDDIFAFLCSITLTVLAALNLITIGRNARNILSQRDAYLIVAAAWIIFSLFGTLPFLISGYIRNFTDAYFETMSGFTTTGASIIDNVEALPHGLLFWRSLTQYIGGLGIVFFTVALLPSLGGGSIKIFAAESTGPFKTKLHPRISTNAKWIWVVYLILTTGCAASYYIGGMNLFDAINFSMTTTATGGFGTHNDSFAFYHSKFLEYACTLFTFLSGINFTLQYNSIFKGKIQNLFHNSEFKFYLIMVLTFSAFIMSKLILNNHYDLEHAFRKAVFQVVTFITTTGFFSDDASTWPHITWVILAVCMFFGACSGSTSGGLKCIRGVMTMKTIRNEFLQILHPNAVLPVRIDGINVSQEKRLTLLSFLSTYLILCLVTSSALIAMGIDNTNAITMALSSMGNVGPTLGTEIGPTMSWSILPAAAKWLCAFMMLIGRLELFTVLVIFTPSFWKNH
ncbi:MAG: TrkH family potassium uptake protein [Prevotella sp.]|jgi:trk system potassium uptake protein TrkH|nr:MULTISPECIES: TrkH family potassium uptake protein [unclassified Prevotella]MCH3970313.1 TrkH family potassium uptake protein [Prevotella sp.]MCH3986281.1 TrkH family potassium uptake protein [Prevotella sp.]MCH3992338.1 TrkH family potassium uptake protein [Prevotella sp.]MCH4017076.1 TrkH family potassium uptake protein [Prevotella sp.]MCH4100003.1 TrkH family potassium uptake protein [Prevotella sp.]